VASTVCFLVEFGGGFLILGFEDVRRDDRDGEIGRKGDGC